MEAAQFASKDDSLSQCDDCDVFVFCSCVSLHFALLSLLSLDLGAASGGRGGAHARRSFAAP